MTAIDHRAVPAGAARFGDLFARIAAGAADRERARELPFEQVQWLREAGFGAVRVPLERGGSGVDLPELFGLVIALAEADPHVAHLLRGHFGYLEGRLQAADGPVRDAWLDRAAAGQIVGNASSETNGKVSTELDTVLRRSGSGYLLTGRKYYSTGTIFADWIAATAILDGARMSVAVPATAAGVRRLDDWDGFGQGLTGSGTTIFDSVAVEAVHVGPYENPGASTSAAFYQVYLLAVLAGIGRALVRDAVEFVRPRTRSFLTGRGVLPREDPLIQQVVGRLSAAAFTAESLVLTAARELQAATDSVGVDGPDPVLADRAELAAYRAQLVVGDTILEAADRLFEVGGASALDRSRLLDRHWRNARTLASHNPAVFKARIIGEHLLLGTSPAVRWGNPQGG